MLRIAIVGCGKIADAHAAQIQRIGGCEIEGVCDQEPLMARQFCERFPVRRMCRDVSELLSDVHPDVVHVTTPPESHFEISKLCLERGCHVYVEKPFTVDGNEAQELVLLAEKKRLKLTVGHDDQFSHVARRMRALIRNGYLGGPPVHMESYYGYDLGGDGYARALLGDARHWVRRLPGKLLQNVISHGLARIAEFLTSEAPRVIAYSFTSSHLKWASEGEIVDELRVIISEDEGTTAYFTFSSQMRPSLREFRIYGRNGGLVLDQDQETLLRLRGARYKSYAEKFVPPIIFAGQHCGNMLGNCGRFLARDFHMKSGMKYLMEAFYRAIIEDAAVPIPYGEILRTSRIMDAIFEQVGGSRRPDARDSAQARAKVSEAVKG